MPDKDFPSMQIAKSSSEEGIVLKVPVPRHQRGEVIIYHGLTGVPSEMNTLSSSLNDNDFEVIVPFLSGHQSIEALAKTHLDTWLTQVIAIAEQSARAKVPLILAGLSFGSLLAAYAAIKLDGKLEGKIRALILLSPPVMLKNFSEELILNLASYLPNCILDHLGTLPKQQRSKDSFAFERQGLKRHSVAASARLMKLRRLVMNDVEKIKVPVLLLHDPDDHLLSPRGTELLKAKFSSSQLTVHPIKGGQHELTLGHSHSLVSQYVNKWIDEVVKL
jgi:carboxylesterase